MIAGIDEVGRGCWAGPVVAGVVVLRRPIPGLRDSKKLTKLQREKLAVIIQAKAAACSLGWVPSDELDHLGLTRAVALAMERALAQIAAADDLVDEIIIDGNYNFLPSDPRASVLVRGDDLVPAVSAASIIAKVARDRYMAKAAADYPGYGFETHAGYGTPAHQLALRTNGVCALHRRCFRPVQAILAQAAA